MLKYEDALKTILDHVALLEPRRLKLEECLGLVLAEDVTAQDDIPCFDNSAMDGYALQTADLAAASAESPATLRVLERLAAGQRPTRQVEPGTAIKVMTGGVIPVGASAVIPVEDVQDLGHNIQIDHPAKQGQNIRPAGEDMKNGEAALPAGTELNAYRLALLAAVGVANPLVYPPPKVTVLATGSELAPVEASLRPGMVRDSASVAVAAQLREMRAVPVHAGIVTDVQSEVESRLAGLAESSDAVITIGAVSMGDYDCVRPALERVGETIFWKVAIRPGNPFLFGRLAGKPFFGLPGNPTAAMVTSEVLARPGLMKMMGRSCPVPTPTRATLASSVRDRAGRRSFVRGICSSNEGSLIAKPVGAHGSGLHKPMAQANCLIVVREEVTEANEGDQVEVIHLGN